MGKKKTYQIFANSMREHWLKYVTELNMDVNPACGFGLKYAQNFTLYFENADAKLFQPGFKYNFNLLNPTDYYQPSLMRMKFITGVERSYCVKTTPY